MGITENLRQLILDRSANINSKHSNSFPVSPNTTLGSINWIIRSYFRSILTIFSFGLLFYILLPSFPHSTNTLSKMFSKRPDKYTTGLINMRNDCFANSSIQAYSSLPGLTEYLNNFIKSFNALIEAIKTLNVKLYDIISTDSLSAGSHLKLNDKKSGDLAKLVKGELMITLHIALAKIVKKLQETQMTTRTISVWTFLHELERIYNARISRSQHDAHELTQLINETLENENLACIKALRSLKEYFQAQGEEPEALQKIDFPEFPFNGLVLSQMRCLDCSSVSKPNITPFLMLTLHPPQELSTNLEKLLDENESETITGYQCLKCRVLKILANEVHFAKTGRQSSPDFQEKIDKLMKVNENKHLFINEDLPLDLENFVKDYDRDGLKVADVTTTVFRKTQILKPPKVFGIHLSRSAFNGVTVSRNPCRVTFNDKLKLSIGKEYLADLQKFQQNALGDTHISKLKSKVLTTDANDMEDESVQREDIDVTGEEVGTESDDKDSESNDWRASDSDQEDTDIASLSSTDTAQPSVTSLDEEASKSETLQNAPITEDQTISLLNHFRKFNFNENNNYRYRLKAIIRHQGSHTQGHYECYKRKPLFVKDSEGNIIKLSPEIDESNLVEAEELIEASGFGLKSRSSSNSTTSLQDSYDLGDRSHLRRRISMIMGRRPSIIQADPTRANVQEIIDSGLTTPAEVLVNDYFQIPSADEILSQLKKINEGDFLSAKVKLKKIPSIIKHPYWRVGDAQISEVSRSAVMFETTSVYMLYYERIDRKQVKN